MYRGNDRSHKSISSSFERASGQRKNSFSLRTFPLVAILVVTGSCTMFQMWSVGLQGGELLDLMEHPSTYGSQLPKSTSDQRTRPILEVLESTTEAKDGKTPWPSSLTLYRGLNFETSSERNVSSCIVTGYFRVVSKHSSNSYDKWMKNMLSMRDCMVIFCEADMVQTMLQFRAQNSESLTAVISVDLVNLPIAEYFYPTTNERTADAFWQHQLDIDPEKRLHKSYKLFWIWLSKSWFVSTAAVLQKQIFASRISDEINLWMWSDIGSFRGNTFNNMQLIQPHVDSTLFPDLDTVLWMAHNPPNPPSDPFWGAKLDRNEKHHFYHSGSQAVAASVHAWTSFHSRFVETLDQTAAKGLFVGEDQIVLQTTCLLSPSLCAYVPSNQVPDNKYFGLRYALHHELTDRPDGTRAFNDRVKPFLLWRPPARLESVR